jgi:uncharacterized membrane protein YgcG
MGGKEEGATPLPESGFQLSKKVAYTLVALVIATCVLVALVVYYAGVAGLECQVGGNDGTGGSGDGEQNGAAGGSGSSGGKQKVYKAYQYRQSC